MADVKQILQNLGYKLLKTGNYYRTSALYRGGDNNTSLSIHVKTGKFVDFVANRRGSFEELIQLTLGHKSIKETKSWLDSNQYSLGAYSRDEKPIIESSLHVYPNELLDKLVKNHSYWINRGISEETVREYDGGIAPEKMENRYTFPIYDEHSRIIGFAGRDLTDKKQIKWKLLGDKKHWVYPSIHLIPILKKRQVILVESIGDMLALREAKINTSIVTFGVHLSDKILSSLVRLDPLKIIIGFNNDKNSVGQNRAKEAFQRLSQFFDLKRLSINIPENKGDFGEMSVKEICEWYDRI